MTVSSYMRLKNQAFHGFLDRVTRDRKNSELCVRRRKEEDQSLKQATFSETHDSLYCQSSMALGLHQLQNSFYIPEQQNAAGSSQVCLLLCPPA